MYMDTVFIKTHRETLISRIKIVNWSINEGVFPSVWKTAIITPVFKSGEHVVISNYRPISIIPVVSIIVEKWNSEQIISHPNTTSFSLQPMRFGFQKHH